VQGPAGLNLYDLSGRGIRGTLTNMDVATDWVRSPGSYALDFDGTNDHIPLGTISRLNASEYSAAVWIKAAATTAGQKSILAQIDVTGNSGRAIRRNANQIEYTVANGGSFAQYKSGSTITTDWTHIALTVSGVSAPRIWINGVESTVSLTASSGTVTLPAAQPCMIGIDGQFGTTTTLYNFAGLIDDVAVYDRRITGGEARLLSRRRGITYEARRDIVSGSSGFSAYWARRNSQIIGGGV
tara:strand:- start:23 stop:745 length:723 start_codon:yes stop_codon:yes gene_type:complete